MFGSHKVVCLFVGMPIQSFLFHLFLSGDLPVCVIAMFFVFGSFGLIMCEFVCVFFS